MSLSSSEGGDATQYARAARGPRTHRATSVWEIPDGVSPGVAFTHLAALTSEGFNIADLVQLVGRTTGRGFEGRVVVLMRDDDFRNVGLLDELTARAVAVNMAGESFRDCEALADPRFQSLLEMARPFNKPRVLRAMPANAARMKRRREEVEAAAVCEAAGDVGVTDDDATVTDPARGHTLGADDDTNVEGKAVTDARPRSREVEWQTLLRGVVTVTGGDTGTVWSISQLKSVVSPALANSVQKGGRVKWLSDKGLIASASPGRRTGKYRLTQLGVERARELAMM